MKIIGIPSSQGSLDKNIGCEKAPQILYPQGELIGVVEGDLEETDSRIYSKAKETFLKNQNALFIGGDHSITYSIFKAFSEENENACLVIFDAHADATKGIKPVSHEDMNRELIDDSLLAPENLLIIGLRKTWENEDEFLEVKKIKTIKGKEVKKEFEKAKKELRDFIRNKKNIYLSIDIDVLDPVIAPGTGYPEKNGLNEKEFFEMLQIILDSGKVKSGDLVEVNPEIEEEKTTQIAKKIIKRIINNSRFIQ